jgi:hypothetical protein
MGDTHFKEEVEDRYRAETMDRRMEKRGMRKQKL